MSIIFTALLAVGALNVLLRPITASLEVRECLSAIQAGQLRVARVGGHGVVEAKENIQRWRNGIAPEEIASFDRARALWDRLYRINPDVLERLCEVA